MNCKILALTVLTMVGLAPSVASAQIPSRTPAQIPAAAEVVAEWNALPYLLSETAAAGWRSSPLHGKALVQGLKLDSQGTMYVSTARWGGPDVPATLSRLVVRQGDGFALQPFPSEAANAVGDPAGLKAVLGFEIDRNDVMWILDQGHVAAQDPAMSWPDTLAWGPDGTLYAISNHPHLWVDGAMDFEKPAVPNFRIWKTAVRSTPYTAP